MYVPRVKTLYWRQLEKQYRNKLCIDKFDPEDHQRNFYESFCDFVDSFQYEYDAIAREPPKDSDNAAKAA